MFAQIGLRSGRQGPDGVQSEPAQPLLASGADSPDAADGQRSKELCDAFCVLDVTINAPEKTRPREKLDLPIKIAGLAPGEEAEVTVAAVDLGILNLTHFKTPDPAGYFYGQRKLAIDIRDVYGLLIDHFGYDGILFQMGSDDSIQANDLEDNQNAGVEIYNAAHDTIGGTSAGLGNLIANNVNTGLLIQGSAQGTPNLIQNNTIEQNVGAGVELYNSSNNQVGGPGTSQSNLISGNLGDGIFITGSSSEGLACSIAALNALRAASLNASSEESTS